TGNLKVGAYTLPSTDGTNGQVLKTNGAGVLTWSADNVGSGTTQWTTSGSNIYYNTGNVGIGTASPSSALHVVSTGSNPIKIDGGANMYVSLYEGGTYRGYLGSFYSGNAADVDFGTGIGNTTGGVDLSIQGVPKLTVNPDGNLTLGGVVNNSLTVAGSTSYLRMNATLLTGTAWSYSNDGYYNYVNCISAAGGGGIVASFANTTEPYQFTVWGNMQANGFQSNSDRKLKTNIQPLSDVFSAIDVVEKLNPVTYDFKKDEYKIMNLPSQKQFGFIAQEIQQVLPNLVQSSNTAVSQDENGNLVRDQILSVNYIEVIPILTEAIQEQQKQIDDLKNQIQILSSDKSQMNDGTISLNPISTAMLGQNVPNPFDNSTLIPFRIPKGCNSASIMITSSAEGKVITVIPVSCDENHISIDGGQLTTGTYTYSLIVDGVTISTRQMILTK
ncbi:MAG TPA: hypothetical protein DCQ93_01550, partial [Bacteroidetes bacterium]|nr:hypothetical protein [Bacteroidota bacterium]